MRHVISTHWLRRTARMAERRYLLLQADAFGENELDAQVACRTLGIGPNTKLDVERSRFERAKWRVVGTG